MCIVPYVCSFARSSPRGALLDRGQGRRHSLPDPSSICVCALLALLLVFVLNGPLIRVVHALPPPLVAEDGLPPEVAVDSSDRVHVELDPLALEGDLVAGPKPPRVPDDPCLPSLYKDWHELSQEAKTEGQGRGFGQFRIVLDRSRFTLSFEGLRQDGSAQVLYQSPCGLGDVETPTPEGQFVINHVYCYPDVVFFGNSGERVPQLYNGFFAPVLLCDEQGRCDRFRELGIHGFTASAHPQPTEVRRETCGAVSSGCIRVPDPCKLKAELIRTVGIGPLKTNDRGTYHWLDKPVAVIIHGQYPGATDPMTVASILKQGLSQVQQGLKSLLGVFGP
jgi:hypothetical protein